MRYYESFGLGQACAQSELPTLDSVRYNEERCPNSTIDAVRLVATIKRLTGASEGRRFLDIGCGYGFFSKEAVHQGFEVTALEVAKNDRLIAQQMTGLAPVDSSFEDFEHRAESFSAILMSQILEHVLDVNLWMQKANVLLEKGGILAIALPNFGSLSRIILKEREPYICPPAHLNFFDPRSLQALLTRHGFRVEAVQWVSRIPLKSLERRLPHMAKPLLPWLLRISSSFLSIVDSLHLGVMINVYARKSCASTIASTQQNTNDVASTGRRGHPVKLQHVADARDETTHVRDRA